jgi:hypothetical protein
VTPNTFTTALAELRLPGVFNPYADCCKVFDRVDAPWVRRRNLERFLGAALDHRVESMDTAVDGEPACPSLTKCISTSLVVSLAACICSVRRTDRSSPNGRRRLSGRC